MWKTHETLVNQGPGANALQLLSKWSAQRIWVYESKKLQYCCEFWDSCSFY